MAKRQIDKYATMKKEYNELLVNKNNPKRLQQIKDFLDYFEYGIKK